jgi:hypothetical protein
MFLITQSKYKILVFILLGALLAGGIATMYFKTRGTNTPSVQVSAGLYLDLPSSLPAGWYAHRRSESFFIITKQKVLPDIGATEGYAYGDQVMVSVETTTLSPQAWVVGQQWLDDTALIRSKTWIEMHGRAVLQVRHETEASPELTDFIFVGDKVYTISAYPDGGDAISVFSTLLDAYTSSPAGDPSGISYDMQFPQGMAVAPVQMAYPVQMPQGVPSMIGNPGVVAGFSVINHIPSGLLGIDRTATTTSLPMPNGDTSLDPVTMQVVSVDPFVLVQKPDGTHIEYIYDSGTIVSDEAKSITVPRLVSGGVVFRDQYDTARVYALGDGGVINGLPASASLAFVPNSMRYLSDGRDVYFITLTTTSIMQTAKDFSVSKVPDADAKTFTVLYPEANFAKDANHYFLNGERVTDMTPQTVHPLSPNMFIAYADNQWLYRINFTMDPSEQYSGRRYRDSGTITKEALKDAYYRAIAEVSAEKGQYTQYAIKSDGVWYGAMKIADADRASFELVVGLSDFFSMRGGVSYEYARDATHVYYQGVQIPNADRETFIPVASNSAYSADRSRVFLNGIEIPGADPTTFEPLWYPIYEGCSLGRYAKDARHVFYKNQTVEGADPGSFKALYGEYGRDTKGIYFQGVFHPEIDPQTFVGADCNYG